MPSVPTWIQYPAVVGVPVLSAQKVAIPIWPAVRLSESWRISSRAVTNAADPNAGGGPGRNWLAEVRKQGGTPRSRPPAVVAGVGGVLVPNPGAPGMGPGETGGGTSVWAPAPL